MVKFLNDTIVQPKESQWFEFYEPGQDQRILPLKQSKLYKNVRDNDLLYIYIFCYIYLYIVCLQLGLEQMDLNKKLQFLSVEGDHLAISREWFVEHLVPLLLEQY